jgi:mono/diheme cytochrome c family protein
MRLILGVLAAFSLQAAAADDFFEAKIRPVLVKNCFACHTSAQSGGLRLDSREAMLKGGRTGPAIVAGDPEHSLLLEAVRQEHARVKMPPSGKLDDGDIANLSEWIRDGAKWPKGTEPLPEYKLTAAQKSFWSFQPVQEREPPKSAVPRWSGTAVDRFVYDRLAQKGFTPAGKASKLVLIRRATYDLTGLPPTPAEIDAFLADQSPKAFEKLVDRLLASPAYGERWGRHWLDVARYADTSGCNSDFPIPAAYRYRNWVIDAFNRDMPYDEFLREQIAGDLLPSKTDDERKSKIIATGYLAISRRFGSGANEFHLTIDDTIDNIGKGMLGLTVSCARCHDHKFDPIPTRDYYSLYGILNSTKYAFPGTEVQPHPKDFVSLGTPAQTEALQKYQAEIYDLYKKYRELQLEKPKGTRPVADIDKEMAEIKQKIAERQRNAPKGETAYAVSEGTPGNARIMRVGDPKSLGPEAPRTFLTVLGGEPLPKDENGSGRLELAGWIANEKNPLTARVMVNRIWEHHFGKGLVSTSNDFGFRGSAPTHPELLDYLAAKFVESGWSVKAMHRMIMLTEAYQMASTWNPKAAATDARNESLWRFDRRRLDAEEIRDAMLATSGALDPTPAAGHPFPPEVEWHYTQHKPFIAVYETNHRSVYLMQQRIKKQPFLETFDGADPNASTGSRAQSTTGLQALFMMNDPFAFDQADKLAVRVGMAYNSDSERVTYAFRLLYGRKPTPEEILTSSAYLRKARAAMDQTKLPEDQRARAALASYMRVLYSSDEFVFLD